MSRHKFADIDIQDLLEDTSWRKSAAAESVDYEAVEKAFMEQAYGLVANKSKPLFRDHIRLGFEIVHRNEKATRMVGMFVFRCGHSLLYVPVFFLNGEVKGGDMIYRSDVKRFTPNTEEWCSYFVRGANEDSGTLVERGRPRQSEAYLDRLAYPQRIKYASEDGVESTAAVFQEMVKIACEDEPSRLLLPDFLKAGGREALEKFADFIDGSVTAERLISETYSPEQIFVPLEDASKSASAEEDLTGSVVLITDVSMAKEAKERSAVINDGYALKDYRELKTVRHVTTTIDSPTVFLLQEEGPVSVLKSDGTMMDAVILRDRSDWLDGSCPLYDLETSRHSATLVNLDKGQAIVDKYVPNRNFDWCGKPKDRSSLEKHLVKVPDAQVGKTYILVRPDTNECSSLFKVIEKVGDGVFRIRSRYDFSMPDLRYVAKADAAAPEKGYVNGDFRLLEIETKEQERSSKCFDPVWDETLMSPSQLDSWIRTAGGKSHSDDIKITKTRGDLFSVSSNGSMGHTKVAHSLTKFDALIKLAGDYEMPVPLAEKMIEEADEKGSTAFRLYDHREKNAFVTRILGQEHWIKGFDPTLGVAVDSPQAIVLQTHTPERHQQVMRYGDTYQNDGKGNRNDDWDPESDGMPHEFIMTASPEELAQTARNYNMPHVFDHGVIGQLAGSVHDTISQVKAYIPDLEQGVDRTARILFLLRYRPADFEEAYGRDTLMEMESELSNVFQLSGQSLLRLLKRFEADKFTAQTDA